MANRIDTEVPIAGGAPVGLPLGIDLAHRGIDVTLAAVGAAEPPREMQPCQRPHNGEILSFERRARCYPITSSFVACSSGNSR
jgi:hypothetical protein